jgi:hypothetical protein
MALAPIAGSLATEVRQIILVEAVAPGPHDVNNVREWRFVSEGESAQTGGRPGIKKEMNALKKRLNELHARKAELETAMKK